MKGIFGRLFGGVINFFSAIFNAGIRLKYVVILCALIGFGTYSVTSYMTVKKVGGKDDYDEAMQYIAVKDLIDENYIDPVDRQTMGDAAIKAMISSLGDNWSYYMSADEYRTYQLSSSNDYSDIGMSWMKDVTTGGFQILSVDPNSPAAAANVLPGMIIIGVDMQDITQLSEEEARTLIRSKLNSQFYLSMSGGYTIQVDCTSVSFAAVNSRLEKTGAGYIQIRNFEAGSGQAAVDAIEALLAQNAEAFVIDLRDNPGGLTEEVATLLDYLLPRGTLFSQIKKNGDAVVTESDGVCIQLPMCVLVNEGTYREAELCAAVLQEYDWASIMGVPTTGNTRVQDTLPLENGSALRLSTGSYLTPNGVDISKKGGVVPDRIVYNQDAAATGTTEGTTGGQDGTASVSNDLQLMEALNILSRSQTY